MKRVELVNHLYTTAQFQGIHLQFRQLIEINEKKTLCYTIMYMLTDNGREDFEEMKSGRYVIKNTIIYTMIESIILSRICFR